MECGSEQIDRIFVLPNYGADGALLVKFVSENKKLEVMSQRNKLKGSKIYMDEDFTKEVVEKRKSLREIMLNLKKEGKTVVMKKDKLWVNGQLWQDKENLASQTPSTRTMRRDGKPVAKRGRSPDAEKNSGKKGSKKIQTSAGSIGQPSMADFVNRKILGQRSRSNSLGSDYEMNEQSEEKLD